jgi:hypothetical protein
MLLQQLLRFGNPKLVVTSLLDLKPIELKALSCDQCGSHVMDVFFQSATIGEKSRDAMCNRLKVGSAVYGGGGMVGEKGRDAMCNGLKVGPAVYRGNDWREESRRHV